MCFIVLFFNITIMLVKYICNCDIYLFVCLFIYLFVCLVGWLFVLYVCACYPRRNIIVVVVVVLYAYMTHLLYKDTRR